MRTAACLVLLAACVSAKRNTSTFSPYDTFSLLDCSECTAFSNTIWCTEAKGGDKETYVISKRNVSVGNALVYKRDRYTLAEKKRDFPNDVANAGKFCWAGA